MKSITRRDTQPSLAVLSKSSSVVSRVTSRLGIRCQCRCVLFDVGSKNKSTMKRAIAIAALILVFFALGWVGACIVVQHQSSERIARIEERQGEFINRIRQRIYGSNYFHRKGISPEDDARLERFDPAASKAFITLSYVGGMGSSDTHLTIEGNGTVSVTEHGAKRKIATMDQGRCWDFFKRMITSGVLNYSTDVIELKEDLKYPSSHAGVLDAPDTRFQISVPELGIEKMISLGAPAQTQLKSNPDIIEFQLVATLEKEIVGFIPKDDPLWSPPNK